MALVNREAALNKAIQLINCCEIGSGLELMSYKRNRTIALIRTSENTVTFLENGYTTREAAVEMTILKKLLKSAIAYEFPRSRKIRFHLFESREELQRIHQII